jgi:hypothetical protein
MGRKDLESSMEKIGNPPLLWRGPRILDLLDHLLREGRVGALEVCHLL